MSFSLCSMSATFMDRLRFPHSSPLPPRLFPSLRLNLANSAAVSYGPASHNLPKDTEGSMDCLGEADHKETCDSGRKKSILDDIIPHLLNLYGSCATPHDFEIYSPSASFEDPLMSAHGLKQIKSAFYSVGKVFSESRIVEYSVKENAISPGKREIWIDTKQHYKFLGRDIELTSLIKLCVEGEKVVRHEDWWDREPLRNRDTVHAPFVGRALEIARRGSMLVTHVMMGFGKD